MARLPADPPSPVAIARALCGLTGVLPKDLNYEQGCLEAAHAFLSEDPPNVAAARGELADGMAHAFRQNWREDARPETWLVAACAMLLAIE